MYNRQIPIISTDLKKTRRAIIALGCSFTQGQGAFDQDLLETLDWKFEKLGVPLQLDLKDSQIQDLLNRYPILRRDQYTNNIDWTFMEYKNSYVNVLCEKYFEGKFTPINLGIRGCGNRATIKDLYYYPEFEFEKLEEIVVIYSPSGLERFDFAADTWFDHHKWKCMWPHFNDIEDGPRKTLWKGYKEHLHSEKFEILEQIAHVQELLLWCKFHRAKLLITPGFDSRYNRSYFFKELGKVLIRNIAGDIGDAAQTNPCFERDKLLKMFPWENFFEPDGCPTFADLCIKQEFPSSWKERHFFEFLGKGSPNLWITGCAHPSAKGHDLFARHLHRRILEL